MTSTSFNVGLRDGQRLSSRVLRPPGGGHTQLFGEGEELQNLKNQKDSFPETISETQQGEQSVTEVNGGSEPGVKEDKIEQEALPVEELKEEQVVAPAAAPAEPAAPAAEPAAPLQGMPRRARVPPGGYSSGLCMSESTSTGCGSTTNDEEDAVDVSSTMAAQPEPKATTAQPPKAASEAQMDEYQLPSNIDLRYGGQYLTPEQLPEFCDQLHNLVEVIRNIQSYAKVTGEYPSELERRLEREAREVAALASEARNARDVVARTRAQRRALRSQKKHLVSHLSTLRETEVRELESTVRLSDRKLYKNWESLNDSTDPAVFTPLLDEIKNKQSALDCLVRLVESRKSAIARNAPAPPPTPLPPPPPLPHDTSEEPASGASGGRQRQERQESTRRVNKRRRKEGGAGGAGGAREPRSVPLSGENSRHEPQPQVQGNECSSRYRTGSAGGGAGPLAPLEFSSHGSVRDILFFTSR